MRLELATQGETLGLAIHDSRVFVPNLVSLLTAAHVHVRPGDVVCDVGFGSGLLSVLAAKLGASKVYGVDPNPAALADARANARRNGVADRCVFMTGTFFDPLPAGVKCDVVVSTLPNVRSSDAGPWSGGPVPTLRRSVDGGDDGEDLKIELVKRAKRILRPGGRIYLSNVGWCNPPRCLDAVAKAGLRARAVASAEIPQWGRGNNFRAWLKARPGSHRLSFRYPALKDSRAVIVEAARPSAPRAARKASVVKLSWR